MAPKRAKPASAPTRRSGRIASRESSQEPNSTAPLPSVLPAVTDEVEDSTRVLPAITEKQPSPPATEQKTTSPPAKQQKKTKDTATAEDIIHRLVTDAANKNTRSLKATAKNLGLTSKLQAVVIGLAQQRFDLQEKYEALRDELGEMTAERDHFRKKANNSFRRQAFHRKLEEEYGPAPIDPSPPVQPVQEEPAVAESNGITAASAAENEHSEPAEDSAADPVPSANTAPLVASPRLDFPPATPVAPSSSSAAIAAPESEPARPAAGPAESPWARFMPRNWVPGLRRTRAAEAPAATLATAVRAVEQPERGIKRPHTTGKMRSVKDREVPTSLSTVTEYTEPPSFMESVPDTTPSKRRRIESTPLMEASINSSVAPMGTPYVTSAPMMSSPFGTSAEQSSTPLATSGAPTNTSSVTSSNPLRTSVTSTSTPKRTSTTPRPKRTLASVRAQQLAKSQASNHHVPYAWERDVAKQAPKEKNADARLAKMRELEYHRAQMRELKYHEAQAKLLEADPDVMEIEGQSAIRRKRVKVDHLAEIPHNRPGDSSSTFRVPDIDSDDEMSVDEDVEEMTNVFEEGSTTGMEEAGVKEAPKAAEAKASGAKEGSKEGAKEVGVNETVGQEQVLQQEKWVFEFPEVGPRDPNAHMSEEESAMCGAMFSKGLAEFLAAGGH